MSDDVKRGDRFVFRTPAVPDQPVQITVTRVARNGSWADIVCTPPAGAPWRKRQQLPMPEHITRVENGEPKVRVIEVPVPDLTVTEVGPNSYRVVLGDPWAEPEGAVTGMPEPMISQRFTGWCLRAWNHPLTDHTHVCQESVHLAPGRHRCRCGIEWGGVAARVAPPKDAVDLVEPEGGDRT
jgi:hypothetical protein